MKDEENFREDASLEDMTINEFEFYSNIIPSYCEYLKDSGGVGANLTPKFYYGFYGFDEGLIFYAPK